MLNAGGSSSNGDRSSRRSTAVSCDLPLVCCVYGWVQLRCVSSLSAVCMWCVTFMCPACGACLHHVCVVAPPVAVGPPAALCVCVIHCHLLVLTQLAGAPRASLVLLFRGWGRIMRPPGACVLFLCGWVPACCLVHQPLGG